MLVTFHAIWYVITELSRPAWQKDLRDITFYVMEEAKKDEAVVKVHLTSKLFFGRDETLQHSHKEFDNIISTWHF